MTFSSGSSARRWLWAAQGLVTLAVIAFVGRALVRNWAQFQRYPSRSPSDPAGSPARARWSSSPSSFRSKSWSRILAGWGQRLTFRSAVRVWALANLGRYVPGKVWSVAGLVVLARQAGVQAAPAAVSTFVVSAISLGTGVAVVAAVAPQSAPPLRLAAAGVAALGTIGVLTWPPTARWLGRIADANAPLPPLAPSAALASAALTTVSWVSYGAAFWMLARGLVAGAPLPLAAAIGAFTLAYILGWLAVFAPGGVGVRELVLVGMLAPTLGSAGALAVSVASRVLLTLLEAAVALVAFPFATLHGSPCSDRGRLWVGAATYEPRRPALLATALFALWPVILSLPMVRGLWLASNPWSDQYTAGFPFHTWSAAWFKRTGHLPLWNPEIFGGLPFVAAGSGDIFYPTWLLRFLISTPAAGNVGFFVHYILAGLFTYLLLRRLHVTWTGAVVGGLAYELSGLIASYPSPGHDGKLFCSTMLPLVFLALVLALRDRRWSGYPLLAGAVALSLLGHFQLAYYLLIAAGLFALYLTVEEAAGHSQTNRTVHLGLALAAVLLGFGIAAIQILPFFGYIPFSPRAQGYHGFAGSTSYAIPWDHVPEFFLKNFVGRTRTGTYWGSNPLKLHSEYLGLPVVALAVFGAALRERRRTVLWLGGIGLLFLLVSLGASTPFYQLWWAVMPLVGKTRAPGMAFFGVAFVTAIFAGFGTERLLGKDEGKRVMTPLLITGAIVAVLGILGVWGHFAEGLAGMVQAATGFEKLGAARANAPAIMWGALSSGLALAAAGAVLRLSSSRFTPAVAGLSLALVVGADLWLNASQFWSYTTPPGPDALIDRVRSTAAPFRVMNLNDDAYPGSVLMAFDVPQVTGSHGNELRYYDELLDRENGFGRLRLLSLWDLLAVRYAVLPPEGQGGDSIPGFQKVLDAIPTSDGARARLLERRSPAPYARVVPAGIKADSATILPTLFDPRMDPSRVVLFTNDQPVAPPPLTALPPVSASRATLTAWEPGRMTVSLDPAPPQPSYLLIAENWYPDWRAVVDGQPARVLRGDYTFITVAVPAGARTVELTFRSRLYELGRVATLGSLSALLVALLVSLAVERRRDE